MSCYQEEIAPTTKTQIVVIVHNERSHMGVVLEFIQHFAILDVKHVVVKEFLNVKGM